MKQTRLLMGMPITIEILDPSATEKLFLKIFDYFISIDNRFSTYKSDSEISRINRGEIIKSKYSPEMKEVFHLSEETKRLSNGFFDIVHDNMIDPSGLVKGWAIYNAAKLLEKEDCTNYYIEAGGDIQVLGKNSGNEKWHIGIKNPFNQSEIVKIVYLETEGIATSGTYIRGQHIYSPKDTEEITDIVSLTVIGPNIYEADRFATAAFAMGKEGIHFIQRQKGLEGYMIDREGMATYTTGFGKYTT